MVIFDDELTPLQVKNLTDLLETEVTDRTDLILRIFDERAKTKEAKLQVEIARDQYLLPRLVGMQEHMSHQQGGSGFRGSGEKQIELDRRIIARKLARSRKELAEIVKQRQVQRQRRKNNQIPVIALVGYTNSGKSTLLNTLCPDKQKKVFEKDMLFATLETSTRHINCLLYTSKMNHIVLVHPAIPQNTGNIMRTCVATNTALHIIKPMSFELDDKKMKRAGLDYIKDLDLHVYESYEEFKAKNPGEYHFFTRYSKLCYTDQDYSDSSKEHYLFFGHEHDGIPKEILKENLDRCVRIPMSDKVRSLNLSNCAALTIYEVLRQQDYPNLSKVEVQKGEEFLYDL